MTDRILERELLQHAAALRRVAVALVGRDDADDLVQDTALQLLRRPPARAHQLGNLCGVVLRQLASKLRRAALRRGRRERAAARAEALPAADHELLRHDLIARVLRELLALPAACRDTLLQRYFEDQSPTQIAARARLPVDTVKTRLKRGLAQLRQRLDDAQAGREPWRASLAAACGLRHGAAPAIAATTTGAMLMTTATKLGLVAAAAGVAAAIWWFGMPAAPRAPVPPAAPPAIAAAAAGDPAQPPDPGRRSELESGAAAPDAAPAAAPPPAPVAEAFLRRLEEVWPLDGAVKIAQEMARLPGPEVLAILQAIYRRIGNADVRRLLLGPLVRAHPQLGPALLHFGAEDAVAEVRAAALAELSRYALLDFAADPSLYPAWHAAHGTATGADAVRASAFEFVQRLDGLHGAQLAAALQLLDHRTAKLAEALGVDFAALLEQAGARAAMDRLLGDRDPAVARAAWQMARWTGTDEATLQRHALGLLQAPDELVPELRHAVYAALGRCRGAWVGDSLLAAMLATSRDADGCYFDAAMALGEHGDPAQIPALIGMIEADGSYKTVYGIGYFALGKLTGVPYDESHDGAWWRRWWNDNQHRLPAAARGRSIPALQLR